MRFTVLGSTGFLGGRMVMHLRELGFEVETPPRDITDLRGKNRGHVIYAIGLTGNFRQRPQAAIEAHVNVLQNLIEAADFESWLYLSSTRVYGGLSTSLPAAEDAVLHLRPGADALYDLSKLLGESICLSQDRPTVRVARLSNVYGPGQSRHSFLGSVLRSLAQNGEVVIGESPQSSKDYISIVNVVETLRSIAIRGRERLYNVASGNNVSHQALADVISQRGYHVKFAPGAVRRVFPTVDTRRTRDEFGGSPGSILADVPCLIEDQKRYHDEAHPLHKQCSNPTLIQ